MVPEECATAPWALKSSQTLASLLSFHSGETAPVEREEKGRTQKLRNAGTAQPVTAVEERPLLPLGRRGTNQEGKKMKSDGVCRRSTGIDRGIDGGSAMR